MLLQRARVYRAMLRFTLVLFGHVVVREEDVGQDLGGRGCTTADRRVLRRYMHSCVPGSYHLNVASDLLLLVGIHVPDVASLLDDVRRQRTGGNSHAQARAAPAQPVALASPAPPAPPAVSPPEPRVPEAVPVPAAGRRQQRRIKQLEQNLSVVK